MAQEQTLRAILSLWNEAAVVHASLLTYVETHAALAARGRASARARPQLRRARAELERRWEDVAIVELDDHVAEVAALAARRYGLRGADAVHLASAAVLGSPVTMASRDASLRRASLAAGLDVAP